MRGDASEFFQLAEDLTDVAADMVPALRGAVEAGGKTVENAWRKKAASIVTNGHAKKFSESITSELKFAGFGSIVAEVGPNEGARNQGFLGPIFEYGGTHSPAYAHGAKSLSENEGKIVKLVSDALDPLF